MGDYDPLISNSLGGSLMKDLFADLALGDDDFLSLDQLEKELQEMEQKQDSGGDAFGNFAALPEVPLTAAGLIVQQQQQSMHSMSLFGGPSATASLFGGAGGATPALNASLFAEGGAFAPPSSFPAVASAVDNSNSNNPAMTLDAWSLSLQSFSGTSLLHEDFLRADMARKQQHQAVMPETLPPPPVMAGPPPGLQNLPEYDVSSPPPPVLISPPGLRAARAAPPPLNLVEQAARRLEGIQEEEGQGTPTNIMATTIMAPPVPAPPPQFAVPPHPMTGLPVSSPEGRAPSQHMPPPPWHRTPPPPTPYSTPHSSVGTVGPLSSPPPPTALLQHPPPAAATQSPLPMQPMVVRPRIYANPHPTAEPVSAAKIPSRHMTPRDLCYVVHSILKPILTQNADAASTYHLEYWLRHHPAAPHVRTAHPGAAAGNNTTLEDQMASRSAKATEWSKENKVLGTTAKTVVTRPRALIAVHNKLHEGDDEDDDENETSKKNSQKQRATLWKARVRIDQGYACFTQLQHSAAARIKLLKCFGVQNGTIVTPIFHGVLKLAKGRTLLARTLEQYPEVIPMFLLPATLTVLAGGGGGDAPTVPVPVPITDLRLCAAWARVIASASIDLIIAQEALFLSCVQIVVDHGAVVLHDASHMMIAHALLQRAGAAATTNADFAAVYRPLEAKFMELLSTV